MALPSSTGRISGEGWTASVHWTHINLYISPADDPLLEALETLLTPSQQPYWTCLLVGVDEAGWDEYLLTRDGLTAA